MANRFRIIWKKDVPSLRIGKTGWESMGVAFAMAVEDIDDFLLKGTASVRHRNLLELAKKVDAEENK